jgi:hypothetical protein
MIAPPSDSHFPSSSKAARAQGFSGMADIGTAGATPMTAQLPSFAMRRIDALFSSAV